MEMYNLFLKWKKIPKRMTVFTDYIDELWKEWRISSRHSYLSGNGYVHEDAFREILEFERFSEWVNRRRILVTNLFDNSEEAEKVFLAFDKISNMKLEIPDIHNEEIIGKMKKEILEKVGKND